MRGDIARKLIACLLSLAVCAATPGLLPASFQAMARDTEGFYYEYLVQDGDTLYMVARKFGVSGQRIKKWNPRAVRTNETLRSGKTLRIYSNVPIRVRRTAWHTVQKGESLKRIARKLDVSLAELRKLNSIRGDKLKPGQKLRYLTDAPESISESIGACNSGRLTNGEKLPEGPGYSYGRRPNVYGTNETITLVMEGIASFVKKYPKGPLIVVGNLSRSTGGHLKPHRSHQSGRDIDLGYIHVQKVQPVTSMIVATKENLDVKKTWDLLEIFIKTKKVEKMFIDYYIQEMLYDHVKKLRGYGKARLEELFQYPRGKGAKALIQDSKGHHHHVHIRFKCPKKDSRCVP